MPLGEHQQSVQELEALRGRVEEAEAEKSECAAHLAGLQQACTAARQQASRVRVAAARSRKKALAAAQAADERMGAKLAAERTLEVCSSARRVCAYNNFRAIALC
jgi:chromosome segregation ATPase